MSKVLVMSPVGAVNFALGVTHNNELHGPFRYDMQHAMKFGTGHFFHTSAVKARN